MSDCINYKGKIAKNGYGRTPSRGRSNCGYAHREALEIHMGRAVEGVVMHTCDNRACINPEHLREVTQRENLIDMYRKARHKPRPGAGKLGPREARIIYAMAQCGYSMRNIGAVFGVTNSSVFRIKRGLNWGFVTNG
jgi:hypothetical protein